MPQKLPQIYTENHATFPIPIRKITVQICGNFWVTQCYMSKKELPILYRKLHYNNIGNCFLRTQYRCVSAINSTLVLVESPTEIKSNVLKELTLKDQIEIPFSLTTLILCLIQGPYILDGNLEHAAHVSRKTDLNKKYFEFPTLVDLNKCLKQIKLLHTCTTISESLFYLVLWIF